jgi:hypothetical protein
MNATHDQTDDGFRKIVMDLHQRQQITDVLLRYCRGTDRMDRALTLSCFHPGAVDEHSFMYSGSAAGMVEWAEGLHAPMLAVQHNLTNIFIELGDQEAWSEAYWLAYLRLPDEGSPIQVAGQGRYLDYHQLIDGRWAIRHRQTIIDWDRVDRVQTMQSFEGKPLMAPDPTIKVHPPAKDRSDPSYAFLERRQTRF